MDCRSCAEAELVEAHPVLGRAAVAIARWQRRRYQLGSYGMAMAGMIRSLTGRDLGPELTHYERHRREFERTGDQRELNRMLRTVPADLGKPAG